jgi:glutathione synthase/RimK-type ligase-like ATP-grasp enzyme
MILILTNDGDEHADLVCSHLVSMSVPFVRIDPADFPQRLEITIGTDITGTLDIGSQDDLPVNTLDISSISAVWFRRPQDPIPDPSLSKDDAVFVQDEAKHVLNSVYRMLAAAKWLNTPTQISNAAYKPDQLAIAQALGLNVPRTLISNSPKRCREFYDSCDGAIIYKSLSGYMRPGIRGHAYEAIFTTIVSKNDFEGRLEAIRFSPCLFQEYVDKAYELRITIVGTTIFAAKIDSQKSEKSSIDWRRYDLHTTPYSSFQLPEDVSDKLMKLMQHYNLSFGCIDMIVTPEGDFYFVEINPNGQWYWVENLTELPIAREIALYLAMPWISANSPVALEAT